MTDGDIRGERALFKAILYRAVKDAFSTRGKSQSITKIDKRYAQYFLCEDKDWFYEVCDYADVSASRIRRGSRALKAMPVEEAVKRYRDLMRGINEKN